MAFPSSSLRKINELMACLVVLLPRSQQPFDLLKIPGREEPFLSPRRGWDGVERAPPVGMHRLCVHVSHVNRLCDANMSVIRQANIML